MAGPLPTGIVPIITIPGTTVHTGCGYFRHVKQKGIITRSPGGHAGHAEASA
jgi:hypothetical protein